MNRIDARKIAETITNEQLKEMFDNAKNSIKDWTERAIVNKSMSKGSAWNILASDFDVNHKYHDVAKANMIREFGWFLPDDLRVNYKKPKQLPKIHHQEPKFK